jgi:hypothetical protein
LGFVARLPRDAVVNADWVDSVEGRRNNVGVAGTGAVFVLWCFGGEGFAAFSLASRCLELSLSLSLSLELEPFREWRPKSGMADSSQCAGTDTGQGLTRKRRSRQEPKTNQHGCYTTRKMAPKGVWCLVRSQGGRWSCRSRLAILGNTPSMNRGLSSDRPARDVTFGKSLHTARKHFLSHGELRLARGPSPS